MEEGKIGGRKRFYASAQEEHHVVTLEINLVSVRCLSDEALS